MEYYMGVKIEIMKYLARYMKLRKGILNEVI